MPPPGNAGPPVSPLGEAVAEAVENYRARFGTTPGVWGIPDDRMPAWLEAIHDALHAGRPLTEADLRRVVGSATRRRVVGFGYPPPGAVS